MPITINGSTGIAGVDGTAGTPALQGSDTNTGISFGSDVILASTGGTERARIDSSGRLLVGTSSARSIGLITPDNQFESTGWGISIIRNNNDFQAGGIMLGKSRGTTPGSTTIVQSGDRLGGISFCGADGVDLDNYGAQILCEVDGTPGANDMPGRLVFSTTADGTSTPTEHGRINSVGAAKFSVDSAYNSSTNGVHEFRSNQSANTLRVGNSHGSGTSASALLYLSQEAASQGFNAITYYAGAFGGAEYFRVLGTGNVQNANNSYAGTSDIKLKTDIVAAGSQWDDIKSLSVVKYKWIYNPEGPAQIGLIAQDVEAISPGLVEASADHDAEGNDLGTVTKSVKYSVLYMKAVKALQEAMERIETLETRITALEAQP